MFLRRDNLVFGGALLAVLLLLYAVGRVWLDSADPPVQEPAEWLTERDQEELADALTMVADGSEWVAGCVWEDRGEDVANVVTVPGEAMRHSATTATGRAMTFARVEGVVISGNYAELEGPGFFCWVPADT